MILGPTSAAFGNAKREYPEKATCTFKKKKTRHSHFKTQRYRSNELPEAFLQRRKAAKMTLTVVVGNSGSGKTYFLNEVHGAHKCIYIRQYHNVCPYIMVTKIPNFDYTKLPYWSIYKKEGTAATIKVGGTMAGEVTVGLSGGQRKLLLFELIMQRVQSQSNILICLDEPFAGVTDDFVPYIMKRLSELKNNHQIVIVTNDHVDSLKSMADNTIKVSALDRSRVQIDDGATVSHKRPLETAMCSSLPGKI